MSRMVCATVLAGLASAAAGESLQARADALLAPRVAAKEFVDAVAQRGAAGLGTSKN